MRISDWSSDVCSSDLAVSDPARPREDVRLVPRPAPDSGTDRGDIVLIVDESIAARYLDINDPAGVRSGLARPPAGVHVANFGVAAAITNCSYGSNMTLRHGGTRAAYRRINATDRKSTRLNSSH